MTREANELIGYMEVAAGTVVRKLYETASWYTEVALDGGRYEVRRDSRHNLTYMCGTEPMPGIITDENFPSSFGFGPQIANPNDGKDVGKPTTHSLWGIYDWTLESYDGSRGFKFTPADGYEFLHVPYGDVEAEDKSFVGFSRGIMQATDEQRALSAGVQAELDGGSIPGSGCEERQTNPLYPLSAYGWACARTHRARELEREAKRMFDSAESAMRMHGRMPEKV